MSIGHTLLGLLERGVRHDYALKRVDGQVYSTVSRPLRGRLVDVDGAAPREGPGHRHSSVIDSVRGPEEPVADPQNTLYAKMILVVLAGRRAHEALAGPRWGELAAARLDHLVKEIAL